jgi:DNA-binding NarL/FixJ family response regulator
MTPQPATLLRIIVADDHALFRQGLVSLLKLHEDVEVLAEAERLDELPSLLARHMCDLLLLDLGMEGQSTVDIASLTAQVRVLVVTASEVEDDVAQAIRAGARGVVFKRFAVNTLMEAIRAVMDGHVWMPPTVQAYVVAALQETSRMNLTLREREVIRQVALGLRNAEVAKRLCISEKTVKTHLTNVFQKLGVRDRVGLTLYAARVGIIGVRERPQ